MSTQNSKSCFHPFTFIMFMLIAIAAAGQDNASAIWSWETGENIFIDGAVTASEPVPGALIDKFEYSHSLGITIVQPDTYKPYDEKSYIQFKVQPQSGRHLIINGLSVLCKLPNDLYSITCNLRYSASEVYSTFTTIEPDFSAPNDYLTTEYNDMSILVPDRSSLYIRLYFTYSNKSPFFIMLREFKASGYTISSTPPSATIQYGKSSYCNDEGTAEVILEGSEEGFFSAAEGLVIDPETGTINLNESLPGDYTVSYTIPESIAFPEITTTTNITIYPVDCNITGTNGPVNPSTTLTFSAPEGMSVYTWEVTGNATVQGSTESQALTLESGTATGSPFTLSLTLESEYGCISSCSREIYVEEPSTALLPSATISGTQSLCEGNSADLIVNLTGQPPWTFTWTDGVSDHTVTETYDPEHVITVSPAENTTYSLTGQVTDGNGYSNIGTGEARIYFGPVTTAPNIISCPNRIIEVPVTVRSFNNVRDISLTLNYDPDVLTYLGFENGDITFGDDIIGEILVNDYPYGDLHSIRISKTSDNSLPPLEDDAVLLMLKFNYLGGSTELSWMDAPDDTWCSYSFLSEQDETGFETEPFCDVPAETYYVNGSVQQLDVSGTDIQTVFDIQTITGTPVIVPLSVSYPDFTTQETASAAMTDIRISTSSSGFFPEGTRIFEVLSNGVSVLTAPFDLGGKNEVFLSDILGEEPGALLDKSSQTFHREIYIDGIGSNTTIPVNVEALAFIDLTECIMDAESFSITFAGVALTVAEPAPACGTEPLQLTFEVTYPGISNVNSAVKTDVRLLAASPFPTGTIINWQYNGSTGRNYTLSEAMDEIMLSTLTEILPEPLQGHTGTDVWHLEISNAGLMTDNEISLEAAALLDETYYGYAEGLTAFNVFPVPEVTAASLKISSNKSDWMTIPGSLSTGYYFCADPSEDYHYLDIDALTTSVGLDGNFEKNAFYLDVNSVPTGFYEHWDALGVNAEATGTWQAVMWEIITGELPMFYIKSDETAYHLADGLLYNFDNSEDALRIRGDFPAGIYSFKGTVTSTNGCASEELSIIMDISSAPVISCPEAITVSNDEDECGAVVLFEVTATGYPAPEITYYLPDETEIEPGFFFPAGTTVVTARASNDCKTVDRTFSVIVHDNQQPEITCNASGSQDVVMSDGNTYVHNGTGWDATAADNCQVEELTYTLSGATAGTGVSLDGAVFNAGTTNVAWKAKDASGNEIECSFSITVTGIQLTGTVNYYNKEETPLDEVEITLLEPSTGAVVAATATDTEGKYSFSDIVPGIYNVTLSTSKPMRSINSTDAGQVNAWNIAQSGNGLPTIEKVRFMAGNVNVDGFADAGDAGMIQNYFLTFGNNVTFDKSWEFWKTNDLVFSQPQETDEVLQTEIPGGISEVKQNFYGLVSGDFDRSNIPSMESANPLSLKSAYAREGSVILLRGETLMARTGEVIELPVRSESAMKVGAISLIFDFPADQMQVVDVFLQDNPEQPAGFNVMDNMLIVGWNSVIPLIVEAGEPVVTLCLKPIGEHGTPVSLELSSSPLNELADENMTAIDDARLIMDEIMTEETVTDTRTLNQPEPGLTCFPNPFGEQFTVGYTLPEAGKVNLDVTGIMGNRMTLLSNRYRPAGEYQMDIDGSSLAPGVYHVVLRFTVPGRQQQVETVRIIKY